MNPEHAERFGYPAMEAPPRAATGRLGWLRKNLFSSGFNSTLTLVLLALLVWFGRGAIQWVTGEANWGVITTNIRVILWGIYPKGEVWRPAASLLLVLLLTGLTWFVWRRPALHRFRTPLLAAWAASPLVIGLLLRGFELPTLRTVGNNIGYYLFRPDLLPVLGARWRGPTALLLVSILAGATWTIESGRRTRWLAILALVLFGALNLPSALRIDAISTGVPLPSAIPIFLAASIGWISGRAFGRILDRLERRRRLLAAFWLVALATAFLLLTLFDVGRPGIDPVEVLSQVQPSLWSGMMLTLLLATVTILLSFPLGVLLALGRTSRLPVIRTSCVTIIEVVRGVPLITILFMAQVMLPMFLPMNLTIDRVLRAIAGMTIFTAAYLAEVVRGGLQAVPREQLEAARALGLSELLVTLLVLLPQALRMVIPAILGQFVSVFKDTSLIAIVGLLELLGILNSITKQREFLGTVREVYLFAAVFYFVVCYAMSVASRRVEAQLGVGTR